jgi:hypothetical protein
MAKKELFSDFEKLDFTAMSNDVAGRALLSLVRGEQWSSIIRTVAQEVCTWKDAQTKMK